MSNILNGVNLDQLVSTVDAIKADPDIAQFKFRAEGKWIDGGHSKTTIKSFYGAKQEDSSRREAFVIEGDEPSVLLGTDKAPNAVELVLAALASCLSVGVSYNAAALGIQVQSLEFAIEGDVDLHGSLGLSDAVRPGFRNIRLSCELSTDAAPAKVKELWEHVQRTSPVLDILRQPVPVSLTLEQAGAAT